MLKLFFVVGPESSGNRLTTRILCESGCFGDYDHYQRLDEYFYGKINNIKDIMGDNKTIVFRRSIPHGDNWIKFEDIFYKFKDFKINIIIPIRNLYELCKSKINNNGKSTMLESYNSVIYELNHLMSQMQKFPENNYYYFNTSFLFKCPDISLNSLSNWSGLSIDHSKILSFVYDADKNHQGE